MGEKRGRDCWNRGSTGNPDDRDAELDLPRRRRRGLSMTGLVAVAFSGLLLALTWSILTERSHLASAPARELRRGDGARRLKAIRELERLGPQDLEVAVPALIGGLADPEPGNRVAAIEGILAVVQYLRADCDDPGQIRPAVAALLGCLDDSQPRVRAEAMESLSTIVTEWRDVTLILDLDGIAAAMGERIGDADAAVRLAAVQGLGVIGRRSSKDAPPRLVAALEDESEAVRTAAVQSVAIHHRGLIRLLPSLVKSLDAARPEVRPAYLGVLNLMRPSTYPKDQAKEMFPVLVSALGSRDPRARCHVLSSIGEYGPDSAREVVPALLAVLGEPGEGAPAGAPNSPGPPWATDPAAAAARALSRVAGTRVPGGPPRKVPEAAAVIAALAKLLESPAAGRRLAAVHALRSFQHEDAAIAALIASVRDRDAMVRATALRFLLTDDSTRRFLSVEAIRNALEDDSPEVRRIAVWAVPDGADVKRWIPVLIRHAEHDPDRSVRDACASALGSLQPPAVAAADVPTYLEVIDRPGAPAALRGSLIAILTRVGPEARGAVPAIARALRSAEQDARRDAFRRKPATAPVPGSAQDLRVEDARAHVAFCGNAAHALGRLAPGTPAAGDAVSALAVALGDPDDGVNQRVVEALAALGPAARAAAPALAGAIRMARGQKDLVRAWRMAEALGEIDPAAPEAGEAVAFLVEVLGSGDIGRRSLAEHALGSFGPAAAPAIPRLIELSRRSITGAKQELASIASALGRIAPGTPGEGRALAALVELLRVEPKSPDVAPVIDALARFGPGAAAALPRLRELTKSEDGRVSEAARKGVAAIEAPGP